jgi:hypothetical protein
VDVEEAAGGHAEVPRRSEVRVRDEPRDPGESLQEPDELAGFQRVGQEAGVRPEVLRPVEDVLPLRAGVLGGLTRHDP